MNDTITTELRESMMDERGLLYIGETAFADLCDAIDAVHANLEAENESLRRELDRVLGEQEDRDGLVRLPVDADRVPIHFGDFLTEHEDGYTFKVDGFKIWGGSKEWWVYQDEGVQAPAERCTHYHAPTEYDAG